MLKWLRLTRLKLKTWFPHPPLVPVSPSKYQSPTTCLVARAKVSCLPHFLPFLHLLSPIKPKSDGCYPPNASQSSISTTAPLVPWLSSFPAAAVRSWRSPQVFLLCFFSLFSAPQLNGVVCVCVCVCVLATSYDMQDPSSLSRDWTHALYIGSMES